MRRIHAMHNPIQHTHSGVVITYNEDRNRWEFSLRGRDRSAESLTLAREAIDKPEPKKAKPFEKVAAWEVCGSEIPSLIEVTSIAEGRTSWRGQEVWIKDGSGSRRKEGIQRRIYARNAKNDAICKTITEKRKQIELLDSECDKLRTTLKPLTIEEEKE